MNPEDAFREVKWILMDGKQRYIRFEWFSYPELEPDKIVVSNSKGEKIVLDQDDFDTWDWAKLVNMIVNYIDEELKVDLIGYLSEKIERALGKTPKIYFDTDNWAYAIIDGKIYLIDPEPIDHTEFLSATYSFREWVFNFADRYKLKLWE